MYDTIFLHAGLPKTGSTRVQHGLHALARERHLGALAYPEVNAELGPANGARIAREMANARVDAPLRCRLAACIDELLAAAPAGRRRLLISSEHLFFASAEAMAELCRLLAPQARTLRLLVCVRPLPAWTWSIHSQLVKAHACAEPFDARWLRDWSDACADAWLNLDRCPIPAEVVPYDERDLLPALLSVLGEDPAIATAAPAGRVNRGLTTGELALLHAINAAFADEGLCRAISDEFLRRWPEQVRAPLPTAGADALAIFAQELNAQLESLRSPTMMAVKQILFGAGPPAHCAPEVPSQDPAELLAIALRLVAAQQAEYRDDGRHFAALKRAAREMQATGDRFDPIHYLLMYPDLAVHEVDPEVHYRNHGRAEGRAGALKSRYRD